MVCLCRLLKSIKDLFLPTEETVDTREISAEEMLAYAHREWLAAQSLFEENVDPDLVDFTVFNLKAAEQRYSYLLRKVREENQATMGAADCLTGLDD